MGRWIAATALAALAALGLAGAGGSAASAPELREPTVWASKDGVLRRTLVARIGTAKIAGRLVHDTQTYSGFYPAPTLKVRPGDRVSLAIVNQLHAITNFHFHGMAVTPSGIGDNVLREMEPGSGSRVVVDIPADHPSGLYWYHPHLHGQTEEQVYGGMAGAISIGDVLAPYPSLRGIRQRIMVLTAVQLGKRGTLVSPGNLEPAKALNMINGQLQPTITLRPGETQLWRFANASSDSWYKLAVAGQQMRVLAEDGNTYDSLQARSSLVLPPGKRFEVLVTGGRSTKLETLFFNEGFDKFPQRTLATVRVAGAPVTPVALPAKLQPLDDLRGRPIARTRTLRWEIQVKPTLEFQINHRVFSHMRVDARVRLGTTERWILRNDSTEFHPFHVHTNDFQVVEVNGKPVVPHGVQDVVQIPPKGSVVILMRFERFTGKAVFHCHILFHEDHGMMGIVQFVK